MSLIHSSLLLGAGTAAGGYQIERSLRFNSSDSASLSRTPASAGNRKTWTWAGWVKRSGLGSTGIFGAGGSGDTDYFGVSFDSSNKFSIGGNLTNFLITTQVFRDFSAWMHIVVALDTTQGTASNTLKIYVNGVLVTAYDTDNRASKTSSSVDLGFNRASLQGIGCLINSVGNPATYNNCYLADIYFIDGQALTPSSFTEVSATTGQLVPKAYTGSFGTNGFWLKFSDNSAATATTLGKDYSGNSNNWTPNNFSVSGGSNTITIPLTNAPPTVEYLVIAGGGSGGDVVGGGGGAGGYRSSVAGESSGGGAPAESPLALTPGNSYTVIVGNGGTTPIYSNGAPGSDSVLGPIISIGGGGGGTNSNDGLTGGSGGGGAHRSGGTPIRVGGAGTANQGFAGGSGNNVPSPTHAAGGGGGAGGVGGSALASPSNVPGNGGAGIFSSITGSSVERAGGGGGMSSAAGGTATGGGGAGASGIEGAGGNGSPNTGGGGGGIGTTDGGGAGGSGIVIIRYTSTYADLTVGGGLTYTYANTGGYKIYSFTASTTAAQAAGNDSLVDTPTSYGTDTGVGGEVRGNYATLNPLQKGSDLTLSNGNLDLSKSSTVDKSTASTIGMTSGKWYFELAITNLGGGEYAIGFGRNIPIESYVGSNATTWSYADTGLLMHNANTTSYGSSYTTGDVLGAAFDGDNGTLVFYKNGVSQGTAATGLTQGPYFFTAGVYQSTATRSANFGQRPFAYTAPSGFKALCDTNLPAPVVAKPSTVMDVVLRTGTGTSGGTISSLNFSADFIWSKLRSTSSSHYLLDSVRGIANTLQSNSTASEASYSTWFTSITSTGYTIGSGDWTSGASVVEWCWDAGSSTVTNTQGSITSSVRANASAGFSIVTYTGTGSAATVGHGLGIAPFMFIVKNRSTSSDWDVYHGSLPSPATNRIVLQSTAAAVGAGGTSSWNSTSPTSTVVSLGSSTSANSNGSNHVMYCFAPVTGYSAMGSYVGNGSSDGVFQWCGFRPRWIMWKRSSGAGNDWRIVDTTRGNYNLIDTAYLYPNQSYSENTNANDAMDILSNGFKLRTSAEPSNASGSTYVWAAFAESPFQYARAR